MDDEVKPLVLKTATVLKYSTILLMIDAWQNRNYTVLYSVLFCSVPLGHFFLFCFGLLCSVLFCFVLFCFFCSVLLSSVLFCSPLFCSVLFCLDPFSVLFCSVRFCSALLCPILFCSALFCSCFVVLFCQCNQLLPLGETRLAAPESR